MQLILVRHGDAGAYTLPDHERNLSALGQAQASQTAAWLAENFEPDHFIVSPYNRAQQTLAQIQQFFPHVPVTTYEGITPDNDADIAVDALGELVGDCMVVVCHMNIIAKIAHILTDEPLEGFALAEARVYDMGILAPSLAAEIKRFVPTCQVI